MTRKVWLMILLLALAALSLAACSGADTDNGETVAESGETETSDSAECDELTPVSLQLQWVTQSQFAGYYAALEEGFWADQCLDVTIKEGAVEIVPQQVVAAGDAEFGIAWVPKMLASREQGADLVNIAQVFQRSGTQQVAWADSGITSVADWAGKRVGTWGFGNEWEVYAALRQAGIEPDDTSQVTIVQQPFDMSLLLNREIDVAQAEVYNEYAQLLEATNPETGELYQPEDFTVFDYNDVGTAMLQDHIFVRGDWLAEEGNEDIAERFLRGAFQGWIFCRDNFDDCVQIVLDAGPTLGESHMQWQLNEINNLIWPSPNGVGVMDQALYDQTVAIATEFGVITENPGDDALRTDLALAALEGIDGDTTGANFEKIEVELAPGGE